MSAMMITDISLRECEGLGFREKIEMAKLLERLGVDAIGTGSPAASREDALAIRTIAGSLRESALSCPVGLDIAGIDAAWEAIQIAARPRLCLRVPTSAVQMEYACHLKPDEMLDKIRESVAYAAKRCPDVAFSAEDATRSEPAFLRAAISAALSSGAKRVTICDSAGLTLPGELASFITSLVEDIPALQTASLSVQCRDELGLATACALAALSAGATGLVATFNGVGAGAGNLSLEKLARALQLRADALDAPAGLNLTGLRRVCKQLERLVGVRGEERSPFHAPPKPEDAREREALTAETDMLTLRRRVEALGYDLPTPDMERLHRSLLDLTAKKRVDERDLEALIAETTRQVAPTYQLKSYVINSGSAITATANLLVEKQEQAVRALSSGDGPIDAAFLAIEHILGRHYEVEDFQLRAVTEGREAMGDALVKLRWRGRLYSGHGLSTDIIGASIRAYLNAVNKIVHEENIS